MHPLCRDLVARGWAAWNLEYRRLGRNSGGGWPNTFDDLGAGIDHLRVLQAPLDLTRVVTIGHSAGGHLAALAATREGPSVQVTGVVSQAGVLDLERAWDWRLSNGVVRRLLRRHARAAARALRRGLARRAAAARRARAVDTRRQGRHRPARDERGLPPRHRLRPRAAARTRTTTGTWIPRTRCGRRWSIGSLEPRRGRRAGRRRSAPRPSGIGSSMTTPSGSTSTATRSAASRWPRATGSPPPSRSGAASSSPAGTTGSTHPRGSATCWPSTSSARAPAR